MKSSICLLRWWVDYSNFFGSFDIEWLPHFYCQCFPMSFCCSLLVLRSEIPSGMCAKLRTVAASNNRDHLTRSLYYCLFTPHTCISVLRAHPVRGESYHQRNTTGEIATLVSQSQTWFCWCWKFWCLQCPTWFHLDFWVFTCCFYYDCIRLPCFTKFSIPAKSFSCFSNVVAWSLNTFSANVHYTCTLKSHWAHVFVLFSCHCATPADLARKGLNSSLALSAGELWPLVKMAKVTFCATWIFTKRLVFEP